MKRSFFISFIFFALTAKAQTITQVDYVNPFIAARGGGIQNDNKAVAYKDSAATLFFKRTKGVTAMDGGFTVMLNDGKVLWLFGDSYIDHYDSITRSLPCLFQARNSALLQPSANDWNWHNAASLFDSNNDDKTFLKYKEHPDHFFWPASAYQLKDTIFIYGMNMKNKKGGLGFAKAGNDVWIKLAYPSLKIIGIQELPSLDSVQFGCGLITNNNDGYAYIYGTKQKIISSGLYLARFRLNHPEGAWNFWNGTSWSNDIREAKEITTTPS
ncbi:MAG: hypothetical protein ACTHM7_06075, partial [Ginsengibacter sp.]